MNTANPKITPNQPCAVLVVGHGTRKPAGADQLRTLVAHMQAIEPQWHIYPSFLELAEPTIEQAMKSIASDGLKQVLLVPILLFSAAHAKSDIPDAAQASADSLNIEILGQTPSLGTAASILELSNQRFVEMIEQATRVGCVPGHCGTGVQPTNYHPNTTCEPCPLIGVRPERIALAMVGRGTSDPTALEHMLELTRLVSLQRSVHWVNTGFFAGGHTTVDDLLESAASATAQDQDCDTILVQPHLLFEGELMDQLRRKVRSMRTKYPEKNWILARTLGADRKLAEVFLQFVRDSWANLI
jgi:sirohydrochlorin cobaltochelatase